MIADIFFSFWGTATYLNLSAVLFSHSTFNFRPSSKDVLYFHPMSFSARAGSPYQLLRSHFLFAMVPKTGSSFMLKTFFAVSATSSSVVFMPVAIFTDIPGLVLHIVRAALTSASLQSSIYMKSLDMVLFTRLG